MKLPICLTPLAAALVFCGASFSPLAATGFDAASAADLSAKNKPALVAVHAVLSMSPELIEGPPGVAEMLGQQPAQEQEIDVTGVVIHGNGTVAIPLALIDPGAVMGGGLVLNTPLGKLKIAIKTSVTSAKMITGDGKEFSADVIFMDKKSGLALLKIQDAPAEPLAAVILTKDLPSPAPFTKVCALSRLGADFGREAVVRILRTGAVTPSPVPLIDLGGRVSEPGSAVFDDQGRFIGMTVLPLRGSMGDEPNIRICILPTSEILRLGAKALK